MPRGLAQFSEHLVKGDLSYSYGLDAADLDGDGDIDLTSCDTRNFKLYWFENSRDGIFREHLIEDGDRLGVLGSITGEAVEGSKPGDRINDRWFKTPRLERHRIGDVNGDGRPDVVIVENLYGDLYCYCNSGTPARDAVWEHFKIASHSLPGAYDVDLADFDADGDLDVAVSTWRLGNKFVWCENPGDPEHAGDWRQHIIEENIAEPRTVRIGDFDNDGRTDLLGTALTANLVVWYRNSGNPAVMPWERHIIDANSAQPGHGMPADVDRDGDLDVVMALGMDSHAGETGTREIVWYENSGPAAGTRSWTKHIIGSDFDDAFEAIAVDLDGDGWLDIAATSYASPHGSLVSFRNPGEPRAEWTRHVIKADWPRANQVIAADFDGDGDADLAAGTTGRTAEVRWWRNNVRN
ncbi:MAG: VCBS repeat-containing protein [Planctomycetaceae bacterium]